MNGQLIEILVRNFRGLVSFYAKPNGKSFELRGKNGASKSNVIDSLWWGLGGKLEDEVIRNGSEEVETQVTIGDYKVTRKQRSGKKPILTVSRLDSPGAKLSSPTSLLAGFLAAIERQTFSTLKPSEQANVLRRLCPEIDTSTLDRDYAQKYAERTEVNRELKSLTAQIAGIEIPEVSEVIVEDVDLVAICEKKSIAAKEIAANAWVKREAVDAANQLKSCERDLRQAERTLELAQEALRTAKSNHAMATQLNDAAKNKADMIVPIDTSLIDIGITEARVENARRAKLRQTAQEATALRNQRTQLEACADAKQFESDRLTQALEDIVKAKEKQLATAKQPVPGLAVAGDSVTFCQDVKIGPVVIGALNTATRMRLDVVIAKALGHKLVAVRDASLLDEDSREKLNAFAKASGVQLISEIVVRGEELTAEIIELGEKEDYDF